MTHKTIFVVKYSPSALGLNEIVSLRGTIPVSRIVARSLDKFPNFYSEIIFLLGFRRPKFT
ncbi:MAG: hypothetical protein CL529_08895 [Aequorivita sp.]|nr:hypothetical protein [Aequorivita sp.]